MEDIKEVSVEAYSMLQTAITLATFAYDTDTLLLSQLHDTSLATGGNWQLVWGPCDLGSNRMFVVKNKSTNDIVVSIRGTVKSVESIFLDADSIYLTSLPWDIGGAKMISDGMADGWNHLNNMVDLKTRANLYQFIKSLTTVGHLYVTGHSQGACLASVMAVYLKQAFSGIEVIPYTFASESAGNSTFASLYNNLFYTKGLRVYNPNDIVPMGFANMNAIKKLYGTEPPYVNCPDGFKTIIDGLISKLPAYDQVGTGYQLKGLIVPVKGSVYDWNRYDTFIQEIEIQHSCYTYQYLMKTPFTSGVPSVWPPKYIIPHILDENEKGSI